MSVVSSVLSTRSSAWKINARVASLMDSIFAIGFGLGLRFVVDAVSHHDFKLTGTLVGLWEGIILLHFLKKMPRSTDPYVAYGVRLFVDFICTESVARLVIVLIWTGLGMVLADITPALWDDVGLNHIWRRFRRDLYTISRMIPTVAFFPPPRTVRFSPSREPSIIPDEPSILDSQPPSVVTTDQTNTTPITVPATTESSAPAAREILKRRVPGYFPGDYSDTDADLGSIRAGPSGGRTSRRLSVYPQQVDYDDSVTDLSSNNDLDEGNLSSGTSSASTERAGPSSITFDSAVIPDMEVEEELVEETVAELPAKDEEHTPRQANMYLPPTPSDSALRWRPKLEPDNEPLPTRPLSSLPQIPDFLDEPTTEDLEKIQPPPAEKPPTPPAKDDLPSRFAIPPVPTMPPPEPVRSTPSPDEEWEILKAEFIVPDTTNTHEHDQRQSLPPSYKENEEFDDIYGDEYVEPTHEDFNDSGKAIDLGAQTSLIDDSIVSPLGPPFNFTFGQATSSNPWNRATTSAAANLAAAAEAARIEQAKQRKLQEEAEAAEAARQQEEKAAAEAAWEEERKRLEEEAAEKARVLAEEERKKKEEEKAERKRKEEADELSRKHKRAEEEAAEKKRLEEEAARKEEEKQRKAEEKERKAEERKKKKEEEAAKKAAEEAEAARIAAEETKKREEEAAQRKKEAETAAARREKAQKEKEEKERQEQEAAATALEEKRKREEEETRKREEEDKRKQEAEDKRRQEEEETRRQKDAEDLIKAKPDEDMIAAAAVEAALEQEQQEQHKSTEEATRVEETQPGDPQTQDESSAPAADANDTTLSPDAQQEGEKTPSPVQRDLPPTPEPEPTNIQASNGPVDPASEDPNQAGEPEESPVHDDADAAESVVTEASEMPTTVGERVHKLILAKAQMIEVRDRIEDLKQKLEAPAQDQASISEQLKASEKVLKKFERKEQRRYTEGVAEHNYLLPDADVDGDNLLLNNMGPKEAGLMIEEKLEELMRPGVEELHLQITVGPAKKQIGGKQRTKIVQIAEELGLFQYCKEDAKNTRIIRINLSEQDFRQWLLEYRKAATAPPKDPDDIWLH